MMHGPTGGGAHLYSRAVPLERHELRHRDGRRLLIYGDLRGSLDREPAHGGPDAASLHKRLDRLTNAWIAVSPQRNTRPNASLATPAATECPFCPGGPEVPFSYDAAVFENRFPSLVADPPAIAADPRISPSLGRCEVILYTERHLGSLATLERVELARLLAIWRDRSAELWADPRHRFVMVFENRGESVGATISHPHGQVYAFDHLPPLISQRVETLARHREATGLCLSCEVVADDTGDRERAVMESEPFTVAVPFAARFPFEVHVRAKRHGVGRLADLDDRELPSLAAALREVVLRYDALFGFELPYMMVVMEAPPGSPDAHLSFEFMPLHRTANQTKIRASVETATGLFINDTLAEANAARLRAAAIESRVEAPVPEVHPD